MNLGDVLKKVLSYIPGNQLSQGLTGSPLLGSSGHLSSWLNKKTGAALTGAEREANAFNAEQSQLAFERELSADSTRYQRSVADMQAAGLNPMLAASGSIGGSVNASPASSVSPVAENLGSLLSFAAQMKSLSIQNKLADAEIANKNADTESKKIDNSFNLSTMDARAILLGDSHERNLWERNVAEMDANTRKSYYAQLEAQSREYINNLRSERDLIAQEIESFPLRNALLRANAREANANANYRAAMQSVDVALGEATKLKTDEERYKAVSENALLKIEARIRNGIYTEETLRAISHAAKMDDKIKTLIEEYKRGDYSSASKSLRKMFESLEKDGSLGTWSVSSPYVGSSQNGAASANALPY